MFTPNQRQAAAEMARVCRPGGKIGMANWTTDGFIWHLFKALEPAGRDALEADLHATVERFNTAQDGSMRVPSEYAEVIVTRA